MAEDEQNPATAHWNPTNATGAWGQKRRLAAAMRLVIERLVPSNAPEDELRLAAEGLERYADALTAHPRLRRVSNATAPRVPTPARTRSRSRVLRATLRAACPERDPLASHEPIAVQRWLRSSAL